MPERDHNGTFQIGGDLGWPGSLTDLILNRYDRHDKDPVWTRTGSHVDVLCSLGDFEPSPVDPLDKLIYPSWADERPDMMQYAFRPHHDRHGRRDIEPVVDYMTRRVAPDGEWSVHSGADNTPEDWIVRVLRWDDVTPEFDDRLRRAIYMKFNRWIP